MILSSFDFGERVGIGKTLTLFGPIGSLELFGLPVNELVKLTVIVKVFELRAEHFFHLPVDLFLGSDLHLIL